jgi:hypothetical protein
MTKPSGALKDGSSDPGCAAGAGGEMQRASNTMIPTSTTHQDNPVIFPMQHPFQNIGTNSSKRCGIQEGTATIDTIVGFREMISRVVLPD